MSPKGTPIDKTFPMSLLRKILESKQREVIERRQLTPCEWYEACSRLMPPAQGFVDAVLSAPFPAVIAEIKRASPSKGEIRPDLDPIQAAHSFQASGAVCLSVLTDEEFFGGQVTLIPEIRKHAPRIPLLRKDFIIDPYQVWESRALGADAILLIVATLPSASLKQLMETSFEAGLTVLIEIHNEADLSIALDILGEGVPGCQRVMLGINNRDLHTFVTDLGVFERLAPLARRSVGDTVPIIAESGIFTGRDIKRLRNAGADGFLVGESLVASGEPGENLSRLRNEAQIEH